jgi:hypothetical protein
MQSDGYLDLRSEGVRVSYRNRPDIFGPALNDQDPKAMRWALLAITLANLGPLLGRALKRYGFHATGEALAIGAIALGAVCIIGGVIAYRDARRSAAKHVAELTGVSIHPEL